MAFIKHAGTVSSNGIQTSTANQVITFQYPVNSFSLTSVGNDLNIKFNNESNYHYLQSGETITVEDMIISKIEIKEESKNFIYHGLFY